MRRSVAVLVVMLLLCLCACAAEAPSGTFVLTFGDKADQDAVSILGDDPDAVVDYEYKFKDLRYVFLGKRDPDQVVLSVTLGRKGTAVFTMLQETMNVLYTYDEDTGIIVLDNNGDRMVLGVVDEDMKTITVSPVLTGGTAYKARKTK